MFNCLSLNNKKENLTELWDFSSPRGKVAPWSALAPEPSLRQTMCFAHLRTATRGSVELLPLFGILKKNVKYRNIYDVLCR